MDSLDFLNTHKLILNNKEIDTIETNGDTDNTIILTKSAINNAISSAISGGTDTLKADKIKSFTANTSTITLGNNEHTILTCDETQGNKEDTLSTDNITTSGTITSDTIVSTTFKTASSSENVNITNTNGIITNKIKIGGSLAQEITLIESGTSDTGRLYTVTKTDSLLGNKVNTSSVKNENYSTSTSNIYCCKYIDDNYAKLSNTSQTIISGTFKTNTFGGKILDNTNGLSLDGTNYVSNILTSSSTTSTTNKDTKLTTQGYNDAIYAKLSGAEFTGNISTTNSKTITSAGLITANSGLKLGVNGNTANSIITSGTSTTIGYDVLTTRAYNDAKYAQLSDSSQTIISGTFKTNTIQTNTTTGKNIVNYNSTSPTTLTYGNITDETIINGKDNIIKINNTVNVNNIKPYSIDTTNNKSTITLGFNENTTLESNHGTDKDTLTTDNISTTETITSAGLITAKSGLTISSTKSLTLGGNAVSSILIASGSSNNNKLTSQGYTDATYAKLSSANTFSGSNTFSNVIYTNGGISAFTTSSTTTNPNHIKMKFVDNTVSSVDNDYVEFIDDNSTPLLRIYQEGKTYSPVFTTQNADYAELFEVYDETIPIKDYEYKFITLIDDKVKIASNEDDYILGVYSLKPGIIGNYNLDEINSKKNIQVGLLGRLIVIDNNTCKSNSFCKVDKDGCAIPYNKSDGDIPHYRVMKRIDNNKILIMFK